MKKARIYEDNEGLLVFDGFICKDGKVHGGNSLNNYLFFSLFEFIKKNGVKNVCKVMLIRCEFISDDWLSDIMTNIRKNSVFIDSKSSSSD